MTAQDEESILELSRRKLLAAAGIGSAAVLAQNIFGPVLIGTSGAAAAPASSLVPTSPVAGLHLQFGADASSEVVVSWHTLQPVRGARVLLGRLDGKLERTVEANETSYTDAKSGQVVYVYHASLANCRSTRHTFTARCTKARSPSSAHFAPPRWDEHRSRSPVSAIRARRRSASGTFHLQV